MFPGQGSQHPEMGKLWFQNFKEAQLAYEEASDATHLNLKKICFEGSDADLKATEITQPAILTTSVAIYRSAAQNSELLQGDNLFCGHSLGEYSALVASGALDLGAAAWTVHQRGKFMQQAVPSGEGSMLALVFRGKDNIRERAQNLCQQAESHTGKNLWIANENSLEQIVLSGHKEAVVWAAEHAKDPNCEARRAVELNVSAPFHCPLMAPAAEALKPELAKLSVHSVDSSYIANIDGQIHSIATDEVRARLFEQVCSSVKWVASIQNATQQNISQSIEIGPSKVLSGLCKKTTPDLDCRNIVNPEDLLLRVEFSG